MAIGIGSQVVTAGVIAPCVTGVIVGGAAGVWEVRWADNTIDPAAVTAGLQEITAAVADPADPVAGQMLQAKNGGTFYQAIGIAFVIGGVRWWLALDIAGKSGLPYAMQKLHTNITGALPQ